MKFGIAIAAKSPMSAITRIASQNQEKMDFEAAFSGSGFIFEKHRMNTNVANRGQFEAD
jgi:hypothetical protein